MTQVLGAAHALHMSTPSASPLSTQPHLPSPELGDPQMRRYQWEIGDTVTYVVGVEGVLSHKSADSVTVAGVTLPRRMGPTDTPDSGPGVRYMSMDFPNECDGNCGVEVDEFDSSLGEAYADEQYDLGRSAANSTWARLVAAEHEAASSTDPHHPHAGPFRFCSHPLCAHANLADRGL